MSAWEIKVKPHVLCVRLGFSWFGRKGKLGQPSVCQDGVPTRAVSGEQWWAEAGRGQPGGLGPF